MIYNYVIRGCYMIKGILYSCIHLFSEFVIFFLWKSQRKKLKKIGNDSNVLGLPYIQGYKYICIGDNFSAGKDVRLEAWDRYEKQKFSPRIIIGDNVTFTGRDYISCIDTVQIGNGCLFGRDVFIADNSHGDLSIEQMKIRPQKRPLSSKGPVLIGENVWVGRQVTILSGVKIGNNAIIGANSIVNTDIPENALVVGSPAKVVRIIKDNR